MTIIRNGIEIELTWQEIRNAYLLMDREYLKEDIISKANDMDIDWYNMDLNKIVDCVHDTLDNNDSYWESYWMSIEYVLREIVKEV